MSLPAVMDEQIFGDYYSELRRSANELLEMSLQVVPVINCFVDRDVYTGLEQYNEWRDGGFDDSHDPEQFGLEGDEVCGAWAKDGLTFDGLFPVIIGSDGQYALTKKWRSWTPNDIHQQIDLAEMHRHQLGIAVNTISLRSLLDPNCKTANSVIYSDASTLRQLAGEENIRIESDGQHCWSYSFVNFRSDDIFDWFDGSSIRHFGRVGSDCPIGWIRKGVIVPAYPSYVLGKQIQLIASGTEASRLSIPSAELAGIHFDVDTIEEVDDDKSDDLEIWARETFEAFHNPGFDEYGIPCDHPLNGGGQENESEEQVRYSELPERPWLDLLFPPDLANACRCLTKNLPYDDTTVSVAYLTCIAGLLKLGTKINGNPLTKFVVPPNLYVAFVGKSGAKKTPLKGLMVDDPVHQIRLQIDQANTREIKKWENECRGFKKDDKPPKPVPLKIRTQDYSAEALVLNLQKADEHGRSFGIFRDELNGLFKNMNRYAKGQGGDEEQLLELFDGKPFDSSRIANSRSYERCSVSIYGNLQPKVFTDLTKQPDATGQWARFLFVPFPEKIVPLPVECTDQEQREIERATMILESYALSAYELPPRVYVLDEEARRTLRDFDIDKQRGVYSTSNETQSALHGKSAAKVLRVAGLIHILSVINLQLDDPISISADVLRKAIALVDSLDHWALSQYTSRGVAANSPITKEMRRLHNLALKLGRTVSWTQLKDCLSSKEAKDINRIKAEEFFRCLEAMGYGKVSLGSRGGLCYSALKSLPNE